MMTTEEWDKKSRRERLIYVLKKTQFTGDEIALKMIRVANSYLAMWGVDWGDLLGTDPKPEDEPVKSMSSFPGKTNSDASDAAAYAAVGAPIQGQGPASKAAKPKKDKATLTEKAYKDLERKLDFAIANGKRSKFIVGIAQAVKDRVFLSEKQVQVIGKIYAEALDRPKNRN